MSTFKIESQLDKCIVFGKDPTDALLKLHHQIDILPKKLKISVATEKDIHQIDMVYGYIKEEK